jgi:hypothetical protein
VLDGKGSGSGPVGTGAVPRALQDSRDKTPPRGTPLDAIRATGSAGTRSRGTV